MILQRGFHPILSRAHGECCCSSLSQLKVGIQPSKNNFPHKQTSMLLGYYYGTNSQHIFFSNISSDKNEKKKQRQTKLNGPLTVYQYGNTEFVETLHIKYFHCQEYNFLLCLKFLCTFAVLLAFSHCTQGQNYHFFWWGFGKPLLRIQGFIENKKLALKKLVSSGTFRLIPLQHQN